MPPPDDHARPPGGGAAPSPRNLCIVSGIGPGSSGTGRLIEHLEASAGRARARGWNLTFIHRYRPGLSIPGALRRLRLFPILGELWRRLNLPFRRRLRLHQDSGAPLILFHMQHLGTRRALSLLRTWKGPAFLYVLDSGVYCIRSYNHLPGETGPCTACLGRRFESIRERGCTPFPRPDPFFPEFVSSLAGLVDTHRVTLLTQSPGQTELLSAHFPPESVRTVGMWTSELDELDAPGEPPSPGSGPVVFHGHDIEPKGAAWLMRVAMHVPDIPFLFPFERRRGRPAPPPHVEFRPMTWETGLREEVRRSRMTFVPSLWSAPVEGALLKSLMLAPRTGVVDVPTAFHREVPDPLLFRFDPDPEKAASQLRTALDRKGPTAEERRSWWNAFAAGNRGMLDRILDRIAPEARP